jgi:hypothetical protein
MTTRINPALCRLVMAQPWYDDDRIPTHMTSGAGERLPALLSRGVRAEVLYQMRDHFRDGEEDADDTEEIDSPHWIEDWIADALRTGQPEDFMQIFRNLRLHWESTP